MIPLVIFGVGDIAQIAALYFTNDTEYEVVAHTLDGDYITDEHLEGRPVIPFQEIASAYPAANNHMFVALSYGKMNRLREEKYMAAKELGYSLATYVSPYCNYLSQYPPGENTFVFEDNTVQPFVRIGNNVILWSGNHIGHHSVIEDHNFISSHVVVSGHCTIESHCFLGVNATLGHQVRVAEDTLVGAGAAISKNTEAGGVYVPSRVTKLDRPSSAFSL